RRLAGANDEYSSWRGEAARGDLRPDRDLGVGAVRVRPAAVLDRPRARAERAANARRGEPHRVGAHQALPARQEGADRVRLPPLRDAPVTGLARVAHDDDLIRLWLHGRPAATRRAYAGAIA